VSRCVRMTGTTGAGGYHQEIFCENEATFTDASAEGVCDSCAAEELGDGGMVTPIRAANWTGLLEELKRRERDHNKDLIEALTKARADLKPAQDEVQRLRGEVSRLMGEVSTLRAAQTDHGQMAKELDKARAEIERLRVLRRVDGAPVASDAPRLPASALLEIG